MIIVTYLAILKYIIIDKISLNVVTKGPVARAGSIFIFSNINGITVPNRERHYLY